MIQRPTAFYRRTLSESEKGHERKEESGGQLQKTGGLMTAQKHGKKFVSSIGRYVEGEVVVHIGGTQAGVPQMTGLVDCRPPGESKMQQGQLKRDLNSEEEGKVYLIRAYLEQIQHCTNLPYRLHCRRTKNRGR